MWDTLENVLMSSSNTSTNVTFPVKINLEDLVLMAKYHTDQEYTNIGIISVILLVIISLASLDYCIHFSSTPNHKYTSAYRRHRTLNWVILSFTIGIQQFTTLSAFWMTSLNEEQVSFTFIIGGFGFVKTFLSIILGILVDFKSVTRLLLSAIFCNSVASIVIGIIVSNKTKTQIGAYSYALYFLSFILETTSEIAITKICGIWYESPQEQAWITSLLSLSNMIAILTSFIFSSVVLDRYRNASALFYTAGLCSALCAVCCLFIKPKPDRYDDTHHYAAILTKNYEKGQVKEELQLFADELSHENHDDTDNHIDVFSKVELRRRSPYIMTTLKQSPMFYIFLVGAMFIGMTSNVHKIYMARFAWRMAKVPNTIMYFLESSPLAAIISIIVTLLVLRIHAHLRPIRAKSTFIMESSKKYWKYIAGNELLLAVIVIIFILQAGENAMFFYLDMDWLRGLILFVSYSQTTILENILRYMALSLGFSGYTGTIYGMFLAATHIGYAMVRILEYSPICSKVEGCFEVNLMVMIIPAAAIIFFAMNMTALPILVKLLHQVYPKQFKQKFTNMVFIGKTPFDHDPPNYEPPGMFHEEDSENDDLPFDVNHDDSDDLVDQELINMDE